MRQLGADERRELATWVDHYKHWRDVVHHGVIRQGSHHGLTWLQAQSTDASAALVALYRRTEEAARYTPPLCVPGLAPQRRYRAHALHLPSVPHSRASTPWIDALASGTLELTGAQLHESGLPLPLLPPESAIVVGLRAIA